MGKRYAQNGINPICWTESTAGACIQKMPFQTLPTQNLQRQYIGFLAQNAANVNLGALTTYNQKRKNQNRFLKNKKLFWTWKKNNFFPGFEHRASKTNSVSVTWLS